ncbi:unnamed protein product [Rhizoctonia solani]|uniref:BTB domain-containing protein n=1 Tax=Rhizoctonia solani TaxID=456999 RepID=A0A8H3C9U1_9AGAM|nr:unnamed protein product [Rhizoctonia solani]
MSDIEGSNNNQLPPPGPSTPAITASSTLLTTPDTRLVRQTHRDLRFYYSDGSVVFLVNNTLFKVHASLLAADVEDYEFKHILKGVTDKCEGSVDRPGTSDKHPVVLPANISLFQFCDFLGVIYGG